MRKYFSTAALAGLLLVGVGCTKSVSTLFGSNTPPKNAVSAPTTPPAAPVAVHTTPPPVTTTSMTVVMKPQGGDKESGTAVLSKVDGNHTKVTLTLTGAPTTSAEKVGLYAGPCANLSSPLQYDLNAVIRGKSETTLNVNFASFSGGTPQSIKVFTRPLNAQSTLWACGDLK